MGAGGLTLIDWAMGGLPLAITGIAFKDMSLHTDFPPKKARNMVTFYLFYVPFNVIDLYKISSIVAQSFVGVKGV